MNKVMHVAWSTKQKKKSLKTEELFANIIYYKLWAEKHFGYYISSASGDDRHRTMARADSARERQLARFWLARSMEASRSSLSTCLLG